MKASPLKEAVQAIRRARKLVVTCHGRPDGDALGSTLAMARALRRLGKDVLVLSQDGVPDLYTFMPEHELVVESTDRRDFDTAVVCDVQEPLRADHAEEVVKSASVQVFIDHHPTPECSGEAELKPGQILVCDPSAAATAEIVLEVIDELGVELDETMASQLMGAVVSDTGGFRFTNVTPRTFAIASRLAGLGADSAEMARLVYDNRPVTSARLLGKALTSLRTSADGRLAWAILTREDFDSVGATDEDTESIVNSVRGTKGADAGILFRDLGDGIRVSLRSHGKVDVSRIAAAFGGGGHKAAAGCTLNMPLHEAVDRVIAEAERCMVS